MAREATEGGWEWRRQDPAVYIGIIKSQEYGIHRLMDTGNALGKKMYESDSN